MPAPCLTLVCSKLHALTKTSLRRDPPSDRAALLIQVKVKDWLKQLAFKRLEEAERQEALRKSEEEITYENMLKYAQENMTYNQLITALSSANEEAKRLALELAAMVQGAINETIGTLQDPDKRRELANEAYRAAHRAARAARLRARELQDEAEAQYKEMMRNKQDEAAKLADQLKAAMFSIGARQKQVVGQPGVVSV